MEFALTDEQASLVTSWRRFGRERLAPRYTHWDRVSEFPWEPWREMAEMGLLGLGIGDAYGGNPTDYVTMGLAIEEIAKSDFNVSDSILISALVGQVIERFGVEEVRDKWLPRITSGQSVVGIALTEPHAGSDALEMRLSARRSESGWVLRGEKSGITFATVADAMVVLARTTEGRSAKGVSAFLVEMNHPGITTSGFDDFGIRMFGRGSIFFDDVELHHTALLGAEGGGFYEVMRGFDFTRILIALMCLGVAQITIDETMEYVKERTAFGSPLAKYEGVSFPLVEKLTLIQAARLLCYEGLWKRDQGLPHTKEAAMVKWWAPSLAADAIHTCLLLNGQFGYTKELPIEQRLRDVIGYELGDGSASIQKIIVAREVMGRESLPY